MSPDWQTTSAALRSRFDTLISPVTVAGRRYRLLRPRDADALIDEETFDHDDRLPYWAEVWASGLVLADRIAQEVGGGRTFLELGCGVGLPSVVAVRAGFDVMATDYYAEALEFVQVNAGLNELEIPATRLVDWRRYPEDLGAFDFIAAADVLYERPNVALVSDAIATSLAPTGFALVTDPGRRTAEPFMDQCRRRRLQVAHVAKIPGQAHPNGVKPMIDVYEIRRA